MTEFKPEKAFHTSADIGMKQFTNILNDDDPIAMNKRGTAWVQLKEYFQQSGCTICGLMLQSIRKRINFLLYEYVLDASVRKKLHASFGFCNQHAWLARDVEFELNSDGQHLGTLYETLLQYEIRQLEKSRNAASNRKPIYRKSTLKSAKKDPVAVEIVQNISASQECMICISARESEAFYSHLFLQMQGDAEFRSLYEEEHVLLCRPHFLFLINETANAEAIDYFLDQQIIKLKHVSARLFEFLEKHDVKRRHEPHGAEWNSWRTTLEHFSSKENFNRLWNHQPIH